MTEAPVSPKSNRDQLTEAILFRISQEIEEVIRALPPDEPEHVRQALRDEILPHSRYVLSSLTMRELMNDDALETHVEQQLQLARYFIDRIEAQRGRS